MRESEAVPTSVQVSTEDATLVTLARGAPGRAGAVLLAGPDGVVRQHVTL